MKLSSLKGKSLSEVMEVASQRWDERFYASRTFAKKYSFDDRQHGCEYLLMIIAGFQPYYWDVLLGRVEQCVKNFEHPMDVCICVPKGENDNAAILRTKAEKFGWSCLILQDDLLAQSQNTAIRLHPKAEWFFKIDEDIVLPEGYFNDMVAAYRKAEETSLYRVGFLAPLININANGLDLFLRATGEVENFQKTFGRLRIKDNDTDIIHQSPAFAQWIWKRSIPFDSVAARIKEKNRGQLFVAPVRFSIGAILFSRDMWERLGHFKVGMIGAMGLEEEQFCNFCMNYMYAIVVATDVFVGHLGFFPQKPVCHDFFDKEFVF